MTGFMERLIKKLIENEFYIFRTINSKDSKSLDESTEVIILLKIDNPILYAVSIVNTENTNLYEYEYQIKVLLSEIKKQCKKLHCNDVICVNVAVENEFTKNNIDFVNKIEFIPNSEFYNIWWLVSTNDKKIYTGEKNKQADKILNIDRLIKDSFNGDIKSTGDTFDKIRRDSEIKAEVKKKHNKAYLIYIVILINILIYLYSYFTSSSNEFIYIFGSEKNMIFYNKEIYRLVTSIFIHSGFHHIVYNMLCLYIFGGISEKYIGRCETMAIFMFSGIIGNIIGVIFVSGISVGASGAIYGLVGVAAALTLKKGKTIDGFSYLTIILIVIIGIGIGFIDSSVNNYAHIAGFISGFISYYFIAVSKD